ncbi:MAG: phage tail protein [Bacteroidetes bacterium]|nr:MAG: phage tail protein [Bacteroidota bacterium]
MTQTESNNTWPLPKFHFAVNINGCNSSFQEVSGLEAETQVIDYRDGSSKQFSTIKMPGIAKFGNVILKRGIFVKDDAFFTWYAAVKMNTIQRSTVVVKLLDEAGKPTITWALQNAWVTKIEGTDLESEGNEVAVELIELAHEGLVISNG